MHDSLDEMDYWSSVLDEMSYEEFIEYTKQQCKHHAQRVKELVDNHQGGDDTYIRVYERVGTALINTVHTLNYKTMQEFNYTWTNTPQQDLERFLEWTVLSEIEPDQPIKIISMIEDEEDEVLEKTRDEAEAYFIGRVRKQIQHDIARKLRASMEGYGEDGYPTYF